MPPLMEGEHRATGVDTLPYIHRDRSKQGAPFNRTTSLPMAFPAVDDPHGQTNALQRNYESLSHVVRTKQKQLASVEAELRTSKEANATLEAQLRGALQRAARAEAEAAGLQPLQRQLADAQAGLQNRTQLDARSSEQLSDVKAQMAALHARLQRARDERDSFAKEATRLEGTAKDAIKVHKSQAERIDALEEALTGVTTTLTSCKQSAAATCEELDAERATSARLRSEHQSLSTTHRGLQSSFAALKGQLQAQRQACRALEAQLAVAHETQCTQARHLQAATLVSDEHSASAEQLHAALSVAQKREGDLEATLARCQAEQAVLVKQSEDASRLLAEQTQDRVMTGGEQQQRTHELTSARAALAASQQQVLDLRQELARCQKSQALETGSLSKALALQKQQRARERLGFSDTLSSVSAVAHNIATRIGTIESAQHAQLCAHDDAMLRLQQLAAGKIDALKAVVDTIAGVTRHLVMCAEQACGQMHPAHDSSEGAVQQTVHELKGQLVSTELRFEAAQDAASVLQAQMQQQAVSHTEELAHLQAQGASLSEAHCAGLQARLADVDAEVDRLRAACAASDRAAQQRIEAAESRQQAVSQSAKEDFARANSALKLEQARVKDQLATLSHAHLAELQELQASSADSLAAAQAAEARLADATKEGTEIAAQIAADLFAIDRHLQQINVVERRDKTLEWQFSASGGKAPALQGRMQMLRLHVADVSQHVLGLSANDVATSGKTPTAASGQVRALQDTVAKLAHIEESFESNCTCLMCLQVFTDPVACVPCGHTYCRSCLEGTGKNGKHWCQECGGGRVDHVVAITNLDKLSSKHGFKLAALRDLKALCHVDDAAGG